MSYNIDTIDIIAQSEDFGPTLDAFLKASEGHCPEQWDPDDEEDITSRIKAGSMPWSGEGSGRSFPEFLQEVLPLFTGSADMIVCWEGGDSFEGIRVTNGVVTHHNVIRSLGDEE
jgi:hypothetical protein